MEIDDALLWHCLNRVVHPSHRDYRDYRQEALLARWLHREMPKPLQYAAIRADLLDIRRHHEGRSKEQREGRRRLAEAASLDEVVSVRNTQRWTLADITPDPRDELAEWEEARDVRDRWRGLVLGCRSERDRAMVRQRRKWTLMQIAHAHGISESLVSRLLKRIGQRAA